MCFEIVGILSSLGSFNLIGEKGSFTPLLYVSSALSFSLVFLLIGMFVLYIYAYLEECNKVFRQRRKHFRPYFMACIIFCLVASVSFFIGTLTGAIAVFEDGECRPGPYYDVYVAVLAIATLSGGLAIAVNAKSLGRRDAIVGFVYILFPAVSQVVNYFVLKSSFGYPACALSLLVAYIFIQSEQAERIREEGRVSYHNSTHDKLTGLLNRRAYDVMIDSLNDSDDPAGVVFCDLNALKYTNDHYGHEAGDKLLLQLSKKLCSIFREEEIFRISGDEFVVLMVGIPEATLNDRAHSLAELLQVDGRALAAFGIAHGVCNKVKKLVSAAEQQMYEQKAEFHRNYPELSR